MTNTIELGADDIKGICLSYLADKNKELEQKKESEGNKHSVVQLKHAFKVLQCKLKPTSDAPAGFLGRHQFLCIEIESKNSSTQLDHVEKLRFFVKSAPNDNISCCEYLEEFGVFKKEILVYREVLPRLQSAFVRVAPKCYHADNNMLVFENLAQQGYKMAAARDGLLNYEHLNCALQTLAAMHAGSIVYEARAGIKLNEEHAKALLENAYPTGELAPQHVRLQNFNNANKVLCEIVKLLPKYKDNLRYILKEFPRRMHTIFELAQVSSKYQNVFSHGDLWANNVMFRYGKYGEMPIECRFVDFQLARYAPAILDVMTLLTIPTSRAFRTRYLMDLLCDYYRFMDEFLQREQLNVEDFMPRQQFFDSVEEFRIAGLIESCLFSHLTILPPELTVHLTTNADGFSDFFHRKRVEICMEAFSKDNIYRERLTDMVEDFVDNFVLKQ